MIFRAEVITVEACFAFRVALGKPSGQMHQKTADYDVHSREILGSLAGAHANQVLQHQLDVRRGVL